MRPFLIPINPEHLINVAEASASDRRIETPRGENLCCRNIRRVHRLFIPGADILMLNVNYCFVCGRKLRE